MGAFRNICHNIAIVAMEDVTNPPKDDSINIFVSTQLRHCVGAILTAKATLPKVQDLADEGQQEVE